MAHDRSLPRCDRADVDQAVEVSAEDRRHQAAQQALDRMRRRLEVAAPKEQLAGTGLPAAPAPPPDAQASPGPPRLLSEPRAFHGARRPAGSRLGLERRRQCRQRRHVDAGAILEGGKGR